MKSLFFFILLFLGVFTVYPMLLIFYRSANVSISLFPIIWSNIAVRESFINSVCLAAWVTIAASIVAFPLAILMCFVKLPAKNFWRKSFLLPLVAPPFVSAIGMRQILSRFGPVNLALMKYGFTSGPIDFLGTGIAGIFILQVLHLYPIIYLNVLSSLENIEASCIESAENLGASFFQTFRKVIFPLALPGYFAGAFLVFVWSLTDLGTPLVFDYPKLIPVVIFQSLTDIHSNPAGYVLVIFICAIAIMLFFFTRYFLAKMSFVGVVRYKTTTEPVRISSGVSILITSCLGVFLLISLLPHISVILNSISKRWFFTILPDKWTLVYYLEVFRHPVARISLINSIIYSIIAGLLIILISISAGWIIARSNISGKNILESLVIFPMAVPGIVFAFSYVVAFSETIIDPRKFPIFLLIVAYIIRRLPFAVRAIVANYQQMDISCEEAAFNLGASRMKTLISVTIPMLKNGIIAGFIFSFAFSMMEVSSSLILVSKQEFFPIAKGIYQLAGRVTDGPYIASALGTLGMLVSFLSLLLIYRITGKQDISISV
ncbi:MAG: iron ABC transporter permease [Candidatus Omnitrophica bacterium]|nr:iron ABC transporter permease [Candidatus Omnitrophota bacterium]